MMDRWMCVRLATLSIVSKLIVHFKGLSDKSVLPSGISNFVVMFLDLVTVVVSLAISSK